MIIEFEVPGEPMGKGRARTVRLKNGMSHSYTPDKTTSYESLIKLCFINAVGADFIPMTGIFQIDIQAYMAAPANKPKQWKVLALLDRVIMPTKKPDWDNIGKIVSDALNKIAYRDDAAIVDGRVRKFYSEYPRVEIVLRNITNPDDRWTY